MSNYKGRHRKSWTAYDAKTKGVGPRGLHRSSDNYVISTKAQEVAERKG